MATDGIIYGVNDLIFKGKTLGYISEDGLTPAGESPSKTNIWAAQKRDAPVKILTSTPGTIAWTFNLIDLKGESLKDVIGGEVDENGIYTPEADSKELEGVFDIKTADGSTIRFFNATLSANFSQNLNMSGVLAMACQLNVMKPADGGASWKLYPAGATVPAQG